MSPETTVLVIVAGLGVLGFSARLWRLQCYHRAFSDSVISLLGAELAGVARSAQPIQTVVRARLCARVVTIQLNYHRGIWTLWLRMPCSAPTGFLLAEIDGPESFTAQLPDPEIRGIVLSLIQRHHVQIHLDPASAKGLTRNRRKDRRSCTTSRGRLLGSSDCPRRSDHDRRTRPTAADRP